MAALKAIHQGKLDRELKLHAITRADFANVHFRHIDKGQFQDAPWIAEDFLGTGNRHQRSQEMLESRRQVAFENQRLARMKAGKTRLDGGGSTRVENGKVIATGVPDIFRKLQEQHEAKKRG